MRVQEIRLDDRRKRYILLDDEGIPVVPVVKYLKYLDNTGKSYYTLKTYCYSLKLFFEYISGENVSYTAINISILSEFVGWLRNPYQNSKIVCMQPVTAKRKDSSINLSVTVITCFYDYLYRSGDIESDMVEKLIKQLFTGGTTRYKDFLYHVNRGKRSYKNILKQKESKKSVKSLSKEDVEILYVATTNQRDKLLIKLLFETGLRIGEALSLFIEDFIYDHKNGHRIRLKNRGELPNGAMLKSGEREIYVSQELMDMFDDYEYELLDELEHDINFVFVKLRGKNKGKPLEYQDVNALFRYLKKKTSINAHAHLLRHTHATMFYQKTKDIKQVQERLGHAQIQTTMNLYLHPSQDDIRSNWENAQEAFNLDKGVKHE